MSLFSVSLLFSLEVQAPDAPPAMLELAIRVVSAVDETEARAKATALARAHETTYLNPEGETVSNNFRRIVAVQSLFEDHAGFARGIASATDAINVALLAKVLSTYPDMEAEIEANLRNMTASFKPLMRKRRRQSICGGS